MNQPSQRNDVFISHSTEDEDAAQEICNLLEDRGIRCWIAPRDVTPGKHYAEAIVDAIEETSVTVLVLSEHANASVQVRNEIERAVAKGKAIIPVRVRKVQPSKALELYVSTAQWIDAWAPPLAQKADELVSAIQPLLKIRPVPNGVWQGAKISVVAIGGGAGRALNSMVEARFAKVQLIAAHTSSPALEVSGAPVKIQLGKKLAGGLNTGGDPKIGRGAALESIEDLRMQLGGCDMVFVLACLGGGTGTGGAPIVANIARELEALTVGVVTTPFGFEGKRRMCAAVQGIRELERCVDTLIVVPNELLLRRNIPVSETFKATHDALRQMVRGISDFVTGYGLINTDFADVRALMIGGNRGRMGAGYAQGDGACAKATRGAISHPLLDNSRLNEARGLLVNVTGGPKLSLYSVNEGMTVIQEEAEEDATVVFGAFVDDSLDDAAVQVMLIALGPSNLLQHD